jgi:hypothetical protein
MQGVSVPDDRDGGRTLSGRGAVCHWMPLTYMQIVDGVMKSHQTLLSDSQLISKCLLQRSLLFSLPRILRLTGRAQRGGEFILFCMTELKVLARGSTSLLYLPRARDQCDLCFSQRLIHKVKVG